MRIVFVTSSLTGGGAERVVSVLANSLYENAEIDEVSIISIVEDKITYKISDKINYYANNKTSNIKIKRIFQRYRYLRKTLCEIDADVIISFCTQINIYSILASHGLKGKLIISERNDPNNDPVQSYVRKIRDIIYHFCDNAVFQTPDAAAYFDNIITGKSTVIMNPIKNNLPNPCTDVREKRIVSVARLTDVKNHQMLIKAFSKIVNKHPDFVLEIYGDGPQKEVLQNLINSLGLHNKVFLKGYFSNVHERIVTSTCFVLPSNYEGISNSMIEAMAIGLPVICTDCPIGGAKMVIKNGVNGILIKVGDQIELEEKLLLIIENIELQKKLGSEAKKIKYLLSAEKIAYEWLEFLKEVLKEG